MGRSTVNDVEVFGKKVAWPLPPGEPPSEGRLSLEQIPGWNNTYVPLFRELIQEIESLPEGVRALSAPFAPELAAADTRFDEEHEGIQDFLAWARLTRAIDDETREAAAIVETALDLSPAQRSLRYVDEAALADNIRRRAASCAGALERLTIPGTKGATLGDCVELLAQAAEKLDFLLSKRAEHSKAAARARTALIRNEGVGLINRARAALTDELRAHPELPQDLVTRGFQYWDSLVAARAEDGTKRSSRQQQSEPEDAPVV